MSAIISTGMVFRVLPRTSFNFNNIQAPASTPFLVPIAQHIDVSPFQEVDVQLRVHSLTLAGGSAMDLLVGPEGWTPEDPTATFQATAVGQSITSLGYFVFSAGSTLGRLLYVNLNVQAPTSATQNCNAVISVDLACKDGDPTGIIPAYNTYRGYR